MKKVDKKAPAEPLASEGTSTLKEIKLATGLATFLGAIIGFGFGYIVFGETEQVGGKTTYGNDIEMFNSDRQYNEWGLWERDPVLYYHPDWDNQYAVVRTRRRNATNFCRGKNDILDSELFFVDLDKTQRDKMQDNCHARGGWMFSPSNVETSQFFFEYFWNHEFWFGWGCGRSDRPSNCSELFTNDPAEPVRRYLSVTDPIWNNDDDDPEPDDEPEEKCTSSYSNQDGYMFNLKCHWHNAYICAFR